MPTQLNELQITLTPVVTGLDNPVHVTHAGDGSDRLFVVEQGGRIRIVQNGQLLPTPFLDISGDISSGGERGLLSIAFPPGYAHKGYFYANYTNRAGDTVIARYRTSNNPNLANPNSEEIILTVAQPFANHNGGQIAFGPDGYLYIGKGDGGGSGDPRNNAQNPNSLLGKILRIDVESAGTAPYAIPNSNPFLTPNDPSNQYRDEIWAIGLRNPWRFSFDRRTGDLYIADVGQSAFEEIDFQPANSRGGENYGWRIQEGSSDFDRGSGSTTGLVLPIAEYDHSQGTSVTGGFVYRGAVEPNLQGVYFYGDFVNGRLWGLRRSGSEWENVLLLDTPYGISTFGEDQAGNLYVADYFEGSVYVIGDESPVAQPVDPATGTPGNDTLIGTPGNDTLSGLAGNDILTGLAGRDRLIGGDGNDRLAGNRDRDVLFGNGGSDRLTGGSDRDTFVLEQGAGRDRILDFQDGQDRLGLSGGLRFSNLDILQRGSSTLIKVGSDALALLDGIDADLIRRNDFTRI